MSVTNFRETETIQEVQCSGDVLEPDVDLMTMSLFLLSNKTILAFVNPWKSECLTNTGFSSCHVSSGRSRQTRLRTLVMALPDRASVTYGCNVTIAKSGGVTGTVSWFLTVRNKRKSFSLLTEVVMSAHLPSCFPLLLFAFIVFQCVTS